MFWRRISYLSFGLAILALIAAGVVYAWEEYDLQERFNKIQASEPQEDTTSPIGFADPGVTPDNDELKPQTTSEKLSLNFSKPTPKPLNSPSQNNASKQIGWIPDWAFAQGFATLQQNKQKFHSVSPVWYYLNSDGSVNANRVGIDQLKQLRTNHGVKLVPSIASFSSDDFRVVLSDDEKFEEHIKFLVNEVEQYDLDGLDLDYESIYYNNSEKYLELVERLYKYLDRRGKTLAVAVMPQWSTKNVYSGLVQTRKVQDWDRLGPYVHEFRIMTYNLTGAQSKYPGPIAPLDWMEANLRLAKTTVDADKLMLGVHLYAYGGWQARSSEVAPYLSLYNNPWTAKVQASALIYDDIRQRRAGRISDKYDSSTGESILRYRKDGGEFIAYYIDEAGMKARRRLARDYSVAGLAYWRLGGEDARGF